MYIGTSSSNYFEPSLPISIACLGGFGTFETLFKKWFSTIVSSFISAGFWRLISAGKHYVIWYSMRFNLGPECSSLVIAIIVLISSGFRPLVLVIYMIHSKHPLQPTAVRSSTNISRGTYTGFSPQFCPKPTSGGAHTDFSAWERFGKVLRNGDVARKWVLQEWKLRISRTLNLMVQ